MEETITGGPLEKDQKQELYKKFAQNIDTLDRLREYLVRIGDDFFRLNPDETIQGYLSQDNLPYDNMQDLDTLALCLAAEIDKRNEGREGETALSVIQNRIGRRSLEKFVGGYSRDFNKAVSKLDKLEEPLEQVFSLLYEKLIEEDNNSFFSMKSTDLPDEQPFGLFYKRKGKTVFIGSYHDDDKRCFSGLTFGPYYGFRLTLSKGRKGLKVGIEDGDRVTDSDYSGRTAKKINTKQFLDHVKYLVTQQHEMKGDYFQYISIMLHLPELIHQGQENILRNVREDVDNILTGLNVGGVTASG